jgi:hypothetical protein
MKQRTLFLALLQDAGTRPITHVFLFLLFLTSTLAPPHWGKRRIGLASVRVSRAPCLGDQVETHTAALLCSSSSLHQLSLLYIHSFGIRPLQSLFRPHYR